MVQLALVPGARYIPAMLAVAAAAAAAKSTEAVAKTTEAVAAAEPGDVGGTIVIVLLVAGLAVWLGPLLVANARKMHG